MTEYRETMDAVDRGMRELDERVPDWRSKVKAYLVDQHSLKDCILGQIFGSYYVGTVTLALDDDAVVYYGFEARDVGSPDEYANLTNEWKRRLTGVAN